VSRRRTEYTRQQENFKRISKKNEVKNQTSGRGKGAKDLTF
jgi:hypothetical protein